MYLSPKKGQLWAPRRWAHGESREKWAYHFGCTMPVWKMHAYFGAHVRCQAPLSFRPQMDWNYIMTIAWFIQQVCAEYSFRSSAQGLHPRFTECMIILRKTFQAGIAEIKPFRELQVLNSLRNITNKSWLTEGDMKMTFMPGWYGKKETNKTRGKLEGRAKMSG